MFNTCNTATIHRQSYSYRRKIWYSTFTQKSKIMKPQYYETFLEDIKNLVTQAQTRALLSVNRELLFLYWNIGKMILEKQEQQGWGP